MARIFVGSFSMLLILSLPTGHLSFQIPSPVSTHLHLNTARHVEPNPNSYQPSGVIRQGTIMDRTTKTNAIENPHHQQENKMAANNAMIAAVALCGAPTSALAAATTTAGPIPSAALAWLHFVGIMGVAGGLVTERFLIEYNMSEEQEMKINNADGVYGLSAFSLLISGYFRATSFAKGWDFYKSEPIFWVKMSAVAILGGLSFFPAIIFFRRDQARQKGQSFAPLSDPIVDRITTIINAELLALATIPLFASLMARGILYVDDFPWVIGVVFYVLSLGGAGYKYGKEAFEIMEAEQALVPLESEIVE